MLVRFSNSKVRHRIFPATHQWLGTLEILMPPNMQIIRCTRSGKRAILPGGQFRLRIKWLGNGVLPLGILAPFQCKDDLYMHEISIMKIKTVVTEPYLYDRNSCVGKTTILCWVRPQGSSQYKDAVLTVSGYHVKDKTVTPTVWSLTWKSHTWERRFVYWDMALVVILDTEK